VHFLSAAYVSLYIENLHGRIRSQIGVRGVFSDRVNDQTPEVEVLGLARLLVTRFSLL
jgi:hypothetical protein